MQGIYIKAYGIKRRPKSKKEIKEFVDSPECIIVEATAWMPHKEYDGPLSEMPDGSITFVGPNPHSDRRYYGTITKKDGRVVVK